MADIQDPFDDGGILICSASEEDDDFKTAPEHSLRSTSEEPELEISSRDWKRVTTEVESNREIRIGEKRSRSPEPVPSPSNTPNWLQSEMKLAITPRFGMDDAVEDNCLMEESSVRVRVSEDKRIGDSDKLLSTPKLGKTMNVETEECNVGDTVVIEDCDEEEESLGTEVEDLKGKADDLSRKGKRKLPSWACPKENARGDEGSGELKLIMELMGLLSKENGEFKLLIELMGLLSKEVGSSRSMEDVLRVTKLRGSTFPEPNWWHDAS